jgi:lipoic acid synthetase
MDYITLDQFDEYAKMGRGKGFLLVAASPLTRSSYHAGDDFERLRAIRLERLQQSHKQEIPDTPHA